MKEVKAYICEFCPRRKARISAALVSRHESRCSYNPENHGCLTCCHFSNGEGIYNTLEFGEDHEHTYRTNDCELGLISHSKADPGTIVQKCERWEAKP